MKVETFRLLEALVDRVEQPPQAAAAAPAHSFGSDKPDVHMRKLADFYRTTPDELRARLAAEAGRPLSRVDAVIWGVCSNGLLDPATGQLRT